MENVPLMSTTFELLAGQFPREFFPALELPVKNLELFDVVAQTRHVFDCESFI